MLEKLSYYDVVGIVVPGTLLVGWIPICFPMIPSLSEVITFPEAFAVVVLLALVLFVGHLVQALSSFTEKLLYVTWGGRPSDTALEKGLHNYFPKDSALRIRGLLEDKIADEASAHSLFLYALQHANSAERSRVSTFNGLYAYHRVLLTLIILALLLFLVSRFWGAVATWTTVEFVVSLVLMVLLLFLMWYRAKQRAFYFVREVLLTAERVLTHKGGEE